MNSRVTQLAAAAVLALAILLLARHLAGGERVAPPERKNDIIARTPPSEGTAATTTTVLPQKQLLLTEVQAAREYFAKADVSGLLQLLDTGQGETQIAVAGYLAQLGEKSALPALEKLAAQWTGPAEDNPFRKSIEAIQATVPRPDKASPETPVKEEPPASPPQTATSDLTITVHVSDKTTGKPIPQAPLRFWLDQTWTDTCDDKGTFVLDLGKSVPGYVAVTVCPEGYIGQSVEFQQPTIQTLPKTIQFPLEPGTVVGGVVRDDAGRPIKGATVKAHILGQQKANGPRIDVSIAEATDEQGRWRSRNAPAQIDPLWFTVHHPQFADDSFYMPRDLKLDDLRAERAVMVLQEGITVAGRVTDTAGNPIVGADLMAGENHFAGRWTKTDAEGYFEFTHMTVSTRPFLLTVQVRGFAAQRKELPSEPGLAPVQFVLQPAKLLIGHVVDAAGHPVEGALVAAEEWNRHRTVKWVSTTDSHGMVVWDYPPADAIEIRVNKQGYRELVQDVVADDLEQTFVLVKLMTIEGSVTDSQTGKPISRFHVIPGIQSKRPGVAVWSRLEESGKWFTDGHYRYTFSRDGRAYAVRVEADGYMPVESRFVDANEPPATIDIVLTKAQGPAGYVFDSAARPVAGAEVFWQGFPILLNGRAENKQLTIHTTTDSSGHFALPADNRETSFLALCDQGIGIVSYEEFAKTGVIMLMPWARVQGDLWIGRQPAAAQKLQLTRSGRVQNDIPVISDDTITDAKGRFVFERVYPGEFTLCDQMYEVSPGQTLELHLGGTGRTVQGELILPGAADIPISASLELVLSGAGLPFDKFPKPPGFERMSRNEVQAWVERFAQNQEGRALLARLMKKAYPQIMGKSLRVEMDERRMFHVDNVEPGVYVLRGTIRPSPVLNTQNPDVIGRLWYEFVVPLLEDASQLDVPLDLGALTVLPGKLKPGDPAPDFDVPTFGSNRIRLHDYWGKVILVGFCRAEDLGRDTSVVTDLKDVYQHFRGNPNYAQISLLFSGYLPLDKKAVDEAGLDWPCGLVIPDGKESTEYSAPGTSRYNVLIGPGGDVLAVGLSGEPLRQAIEQALQAVTP